MLENFGLIVAALLALSGAALLISGLSTAPKTDAVLNLVGGAAALAGGVILAVLILRSKLYWRRIHK